MFKWSWNIDIFIEYAVMIPFSYNKTRGYRRGLRITTASPLRRFAASRRVCYQGPHRNVNKRNLSQLPGLNVETCVTMITRFILVNTATFVTIAHSKIQAASK